jgi:hypothetical protein
MKYPESQFLHYHIFIAAFASFIINSMGQKHFFQPDLYDKKLTSKYLMFRLNKFKMLAITWHLMNVMSGV